MVVERGSSRLCDAVVNLLLFFFECAGDECEGGEREGDEREGDEREGDECERDVREEDESEMQLWPAPRLPAHLHKIMIFKLGGGFESCCI